MPRKKPPKGIASHQGIWRYRFMIKGVPYGRSTGLEALPTNLAAVVRLRDEHKSRVLLGLPEPAEDIVFNDAADRFLAWKKAQHRDKPATARRVEISLRSWREFAGRKLMREVTTATVQDYMTWRRDSARREVTLRKDVLALKQLAAFCLERRWMDGDPLIGIKVPSDADSLNEVVLTPEEERTYLAAADLHPALGDFARIMLNQGMRDSEILNLAAEDVDFESGKLRIVEGKTRAARRTLAMTAETKSILARRTKGQGYAFVHTRWHNKGHWIFDPSRPMDYRQILRAHNKALKACGLDFVLYSLRHTFATRFYDLTKDLAALQKILGHTKITTTMRYVNDGHERAFKAMELFELGQAKNTATVQ